MSFWWIYIVMEIEIVIVHFHIFPHSKSNRICFVPLQVDYIFPERLFFSGWKYVYLPLHEGRLKKDNLYHFCPYLPHDENAG